MVKVILSGGGGDIYHVLSQILREIDISGLMVGYITIAAETNPSFLSKVQATFQDLEKNIVKRGASEVRQISSDNFYDIQHCDVLVFSGGDTQYLIQQLHEKQFLELWSKNKNIILIGISAGAVALAKGGISNREGQLEYCKGLGVVDVDIVPHSDIEKIKGYPDFVHLADYQVVCYEIL